MKYSSGLTKILAGSLLILLVFFLVIIVCEEADARAGGGHRYSGGSRSSSSSSSGYRSSGSSSWGSSSRSRSSSGGGAPADPVVILFFVVIFIVIAALKLWIANSDNVPSILKMFLSVDREMVSTIREASQIQPSRMKSVSLDALKARDPNFNERVFAERAKKAFAVIQQAWSARDLVKAEAFLSDGIYEQFNIQLSELREAGLIDHMEGLNVRNAYAVGFQTDKNFDVIHLRIDASAVNYRKDEKTGKVVEGSRSPEPFSEVWSFMRKPGAKTGNKGGLLEGQCPNCGNPIKIGRLSKCDVCNALLRSGEYDWVLVSITQACEWGVRPQPAVPGMDELVKSDPGFNMQHLKERASVIFWRKIETERTGKIDFLRKVALDEFSENESNWLKADKSGARRFYTSCAVGIINLLGIEAGEDKDRAMVEVVWSGIPSTQTAGKIQPSSGGPINQKNVFILVRKHGAQTKLESTLASAHCPLCGAPEQTGTENECQYCGAVMNDGKIEWVLETVCDRTDDRVAGMLIRAKNAHKESPAPVGTVPSVSAKVEAKEIETVISGVELMRYTIAMMMADGKIDAQELEMIKSLAQRADLNNSKLQPIVDELKRAPDPVQYAIDMSLNEPDQGLLRQLARIALADGNVSPQESQMLKNIGIKIGFAAYDIDQLIKQEKKQMFQEAQELLRRQKNPS